MLSSDEFSRWMGLTILSLGDGSCSLRMHVRGEMANGFGIAHGAIMFALADSAMAFAANNGEQVVVTLSNAISYSVAVDVGDELVASVARQSRSGRTETYTATVVRNNTDTVAVLVGVTSRTKTNHDHGSS
ncbi:MAG: hotdog fold thioesterase [Bacteroidetes bacterium]|nr:hotdog fold thioesterase [Bacteroidota bacterium]